MIEALIIKVSNWKKYLPCQKYINIHRYPYIFQEKVLNNGRDINVPILFSGNPLMTLNQNIFWTFKIPNPWWN